LVLSGRANVVDGDSGTIGPAGRKPAARADAAAGWTRCAVAADAGTIGRAFSA
jgi:hypothetical protein